MKNFEELKKIILQFEKGKETIDNTLRLIYKITGKNIEPYSIENYWRSEGLDNFVKRLVAQPLEDWQNIDDKMAVVLIKEIFDNLGNDALLDINTNALEKRYSKPTGTIIDYIFHQSLSDPNEILRLLKKNTVITL